MNEPDEARIHMLELQNLIMLLTLFMAGFIVLAILVIALFEVM